MRTTYNPATPADAVALVTDAAGAVGAALALALARQGWRLALHYQDKSEPAALSALLRECQAAGAQAIAIHCALTDEAEIGTLLPRIAAALGNVTCIVNNASHIESDSPATFSAAGLARHMQDNLAAPVLLAQALHAAMCKIDVLFWNADLAHGGAPISSVQTRKSVVTHYCPADVVPIYFERTPHREVRSFEQRAFYSSPNYS